MKFLKTGFPTTVAAVMGCPAMVDLQRGPLLAQLGRLGHIRAKFPNVFPESFSDVILTECSCSL